MNQPGREAGNWQWRCRSEYLNEELAGAIAKMCVIYGRKRY